MYSFINFQVVASPLLTHHPAVHPHVWIKQAPSVSVVVHRPVLAVQTAFPIRRLFHIALIVLVPYAVVPQPYPCSPLPSASPSASSSSSGIKSSGSSSSSTQRSIGSIRSN